MLQDEIDDTAKTTVDTPPYYVGIGASAGGLEALEQFFRNVPSDTKLSFIVVQHLSPNFKTMMDELLARQTSLPIHLVNDDMPVQPGCIYLLPPRKQMIISEGQLLVIDKNHNEDFFLPIDHFFRTLGQDQRGRAIGIILSGTGSDGSRGIQHINRAGGLVLSQSEETAAFDGMTRCAQNTGLVDLVLPPNEMPDAIQKYAENPSEWRSTQETKSHGNDAKQGFQSIISLLRREYGIDFSQYKTDMLERRIERRLLIMESFDINEYLDLLHSDAEELSALYHDMLIGVTSFFRDPEAYERLENKLLPRLIEELEPDEELRIWVAATASGEEAYSIAMLVDEYFSKLDKPVRCRIFATDVHLHSLDFASHGLYPESRVRDLSEERLTKYFRKEAAGYKVAPEIRRLVVFAPHNIISDAPFTKLHLVSCRNLFIYLKPEVQRRILTLFHFGLCVGGGLWLGSSEVPAELDDEFESVDAHWKMYTKLRDVRLNRVKLPQLATLSASREEKTPKDPRQNSELLATYDQLLDVYMPPAMLMTKDRRLLQCFGGASRFLQPSDGRATEDVADQLDPSIRIPLNTAISKAKRENKTVDFGGIAYPTDNGHSTIKLNVRPIPQLSPAEPLYLVEFIRTISEADQSPTQVLIDAQNASYEHVTAIEKELAFARQSLNATIEQLQAANEEMQSSNEELVASNEELQSTNEELHSVNEELYTVNAEYQRKIAELTELTDDMDNLLNSTHVDTIFLDRKLRVRKFTPDVAQKFSLLQQDIGRNFESFTYRLDDEDLIAELRQVLSTEKAFEREVRDRHSHVYLMRILPYISRGRVEGVVLTLVDITSLKSAQSRLAELSEIVQQSADAIFRIDCDGLIRTWNDGAKKLYKRDDEIVGEHLASLFPDSMHDELDDITGRLSVDKTVQTINAHQVIVNDEPIWISASISPVFDEKGRMVAASVIARNMTDRVAAEIEIQEGIERRDQFLAMLSHELRNPLGAIVNAARLLDATDDDAMRGKANDVIIRQSHQMSRLLDDLLDVSRITLGKIELKNEIFDLGETIAEAVRVVAPSFSEHSIDFQYDPCDERLYVDGDPARLQQVVVNLLRNASKYTPSLGHVRLVALRNREDVEIRVRDSGVGIAEHMLDKIFDMFVQVDSTIERRQGGIGLGLTLVKAVVEMHGGMVEVFSDGLGMGSEFRLRLPLSRDAPLPSRTQSAPQNVKRIAVVEDILDAREMLTGLLEMRGFEVHAADNGETGLQMIQETLPDVALIDIGLPVLDGYEVARRLRADSATESLFLVALTGYGQSHDRSSVVKAGFDHHLVKPLNLEELIAILCQK